jgi:hypothetical protein
MKLAVELMIETRMAIDNGRIYTIIPILPADIKLWEENSSYTDEEAEPSPCTNRAIAPTVASVAADAVWKLIKYFNGEAYVNELIVCHRPRVIISPADDCIGD